MAKRFRETELWTKKWYRKLGSQGRDLWNYLHDNCNFAGILEMDCEVISLYLGFEVTPAKIKEVLRGKFLPISEETVFLPAFVLFQYGELSETSKPHKAVVKKLKAEGVWEEYVKRYLTLSDISDTVNEGLDNSSEKDPKGYLTLKDKDQDQEKDQVQDQDQDSQVFDAAESQKTAELLEGIRKPDDLIGFWNSTFAPKGYPYAPFTLGDSYTKKFFKINKRLLENRSSWKEYLTKIDSSKFLTTLKDGGKPAIVWVLEEANFDEVYAGKYNNRVDRIDAALDKLELN